MRDYTLTWSNGRGSVSSGDYLFDVDEKPDAGFAFDALYYETPTGLAFKVTDEEQQPLSAEEIAACRAFCDGFAGHGGLRRADLRGRNRPVPGRHAQKRGRGARSGMVRRGRAGSSRVQAGGRAMERVAALFMEDGQYRLMPDSVCPKCVVFLTQAEWDAWPKPTKSTEVWDFATETWKDYRTLEQARDHGRQLYTQRLRRQALGRDGRGSVCGNGDLAHAACRGARLQGGPYGGHALSGRHVVRPDKRGGRRGRRDACSEQGRPGGGHPRARRARLPGRGGRRCTARCAPGFSGCGTPQTWTRWTP